MPATSARLWRASSSARTPWLDADMRGVEAPGLVDQQDRDHHHSAERGATADRDGDRADHRAEQGSADRRTERRSDQRSAALGRRLGDEPGQAAGPRARPAHALDEAGDVQRERRLWRKPNASVEAASSASPV